MLRNFLENCGLEVLILIEMNISGYSYKIPYKFHLEFHKVFLLYKSILFFNRFTCHQN